MQVLQVFITSLKIGFWVAWLGLLIHCLWRKRFYPVLGPGWSTKLFWLATFPFFNPLFLLLYVVFAVLLPIPAKARHSAARRGSAVAIVLVGGVFLLFEMPAKPESTEPIVLQRGQERGKEDTGLHVNGHLGVLKSSANSSSTGSLVSRDGGRFACGAVALYCESDHPLTRKVATLLQQRLLEIPWIKQVTYYPSGRGPAGDGRLADYYVRVDMPEYEQKFAPVSRRINAYFDVYAGHQPFDISGDPLPSFVPLVESRFRLGLDFEGDYSGIETPTARFEEEAKKTAESIAKSIHAHMEKPVQENGTLKDLPGYCWGAGPLELPDLKSLGVTQEGCAVAGTGLLTHAQAYWLVEDSRDLREILLDYRQRLVEMGFSGGKRLDDLKPQHEVTCLLMQKGDEAVEIQRLQKSRERFARAVAEPAAQKAKKEQPIVICYQRTFSKQEVKAAMERLLAEETDMELLLMFRRVLRNQGLQGRLAERLEAAPALTMPGWLALADLYLDAEKKNKAIAAFGRARVMALAEREHQPRQSQFKALAKRLGDQELSEQDVDEAALQEAGFVRIERGQVTGPLEVGLGEPACFYFVKEDGKIMTLAMTVRPAAPAGEASYELLKVEKGDGSSSVSTGGYDDGSDLFYVGNTAGQDSQHLTVRKKKLAGERFEFTVEEK